MEAFFLWHVLSIFRSEKEHSPPPVDGSAVGSFNHFSAERIIMDQPQVSRPVHSMEFRKRRALNWLTLGFTYAAMYMGRYNLSFANKALSDNYGWDKTQVGTIITAALTIYGFSALFNGPIADRIGGRKAMMIGVFGAVVFNIAFGFGAYIGFLGTGPLLLGYFASVWSLNMYFQSYSALALIKVNSGWFHVRERGVFSAIFGSMIQSGRALIFVIGGIAVVFLPWQWVFFIPAAIMTVMGVLTVLFVRDHPHEAGYENFDTADASSGDTEKVDMKYLMKKVFTNPVTLTIAVAEFCTGFVRHGFEQWFPRYMQEAQHLALDSDVFQKGALSVLLRESSVRLRREPFPIGCLNHAVPPLLLSGICSRLFVWRSSGLRRVWNGSSVPSSSIPLPSVWCIPCCRERPPWILADRKRRLPRRDCSTACSI